MLKSHLRFTMCALMTSVPFQIAIGTVTEKLEDSKPLRQEVVQKTLFHNVIEVIKRINYRLEQLISKGNNQSLSEHVKQLEKLLQELIVEVSLLKHENTKELNAIVACIQDVIKRFQLFIDVSKKYQYESAMLATEFALELKTAVDLQQSYGTLIKQLKTIHQRLTGENKIFAHDLAQFISIGETLKNKWSNRDRIVYEGLCHRMNKREKKKA